LVMPKKKSKEESGVILEKRLAARQSDEWRKANGLLRTGPYAEMKKKDG